MAYKALITHVVADRGCDSRLRMTASVARALAAEVVGVGARALWPYASGDGGRGPHERALWAARESIAAAEGLFRAGFSGLGLATGWRAEVGCPDDVLPKYARIADLVVGYPTRGDIDRSQYVSPDALVMEAGLPVLLAPAKETDFQVDAILLAWKNTREARRAISMTLALLMKAKRVLVAAVCRNSEIGTVEQELADVAQRLERHGVKVTTLAEVGAPGSAGRKLLRIAETDHSDLIVAGAYGHSRLREWVLGGVTRDLIADGRRYVLLGR
jgi:nucleotide-binding universal stress UspA family protein